MTKNKTEKKAGPKMAQYPGTNGHDLYSAKVEIADDYTPTLEVVNTRLPEFPVKMNPALAMVAPELLAALEVIRAIVENPTRVSSDWDKVGGIARVAIAKVEAR